MKISNITYSSLRNTELDNNKIILRCILNYWIFTKIGLTADIIFHEMDKNLLYIRNGRALEH